MTLGVGVTAALTTRLTAAGALAVPLGDGVGLALPDALGLGVGSTVGPGEDEDAADPVVGAAPTRITRGVGAPCTPASPGDDGDGELDVDGAAGTTVIVTVGTGGDATGSLGTNSITAPSSAHPTAATMDR